MGLERYAARFQAAGYAALVFDYRTWGDSEGEPRGLIWIPDQLADYAAAIQYARSRPEIDPARIALWGSSLSGGHVIVATAQDAKNNGSASQQSRNTPPLNVVAQMLPTPLARCANSPSNNSNRQGGLDLQTTVGGKLNPEWVAWLMGWPIGWASFAPLGMDKFQSWLQQHSEC